MSSALALVQLEAMAKEKEEAVRATKESGLSTRAFAVHWNLKGNETLRDHGISTMELAREAETLLVRFPNAAFNADEQRRLRASLYRPLIGLHPDERSSIVNTILKILLDTDTDARP